MTLDSFNNKLNNHYMYRAGSNPVASTMCIITLASDSPNAIIGVERGMTYE